MDIEQAYHIRMLPEDLISKTEGKKSDKKE